MGFKKWTRIGILGDGDSIAEVPFSGGGIMAEGRTNFSSALIGAVIGAVATAVVGGGAAVLTNLSGSLAEYSINKTTDSILDHMIVRSRIGATVNNSDYSASCEKGELIVGGSCTITNGDGYIQNQGIGENSYYCTYSRRADPSVKAQVTAACLGRR